MQTVYVILILLAVFMAGFHVGLIRNIYPKLKKLREEFDGREAKIYAEAAEKVKFAREQMLAGLASLDKIKIEHERIQRLQLLDGAGEAAMRGLKEGLSKAKDEN